MNHPFDQQEMNRITIADFRTKNADALAAFADALSLCAIRPLLPRLQRYFEAREHRDPFLHEIRFLEEFAAVLQNTPHVVHLAAARGDEEQMRVFSDAMRMWSELGEEAPPSLFDVMNVAGRYLHRAGISAHYPSLHAITAELDSLRSEGKRDDLTLSLSHTVATLGDTPTPHVPNNGVLLLYTPNRSHSDVNVYGTFLTANKRFGVSAVAAVGNEGILPHLITTSGVSLDLTPFACEEPTKIPVAIGCNSLLVSVPEPSVPALFAMGLPLTLIGSLNKSRKLTLLRNGFSLASLDLSLLAALRVQRHFSPACAKDKPCDAVPSFERNDTALLCGVCVSGESAKALLTLATEAVRTGADLSRASLCALLEMPTQMGTAAVGEALPLLLGLHRATAELTLPVSHHTLVTTNTAEPRLSLFLACALAEPRDVPTPSDWQSAREIFFNH